MSSADAPLTLHWSPSAPFVRKVLICAHEAGLIDRIQNVRTPVAPQRPNAVLLGGDNPLSKVPALVVPGVGPLYDSRVICEYLDSLHDGPRLFPQGPARWAALRQQALGDGMSDIVILWRDEIMRGDKSSPGHLSAMNAKMEAALDQAERDAPSLDRPFDIGHIGLGCALSYLDFRLSEIEWRTNRPALSAWYDIFASRPSVAAYPLTSDKPV